MLWELERDLCELGDLGRVFRKVIFFVGFKG